MPATIYPLLGIAGKPNASGAYGLVRVLTEIFTYESDGVASYAICAPIPKGARLIDLAINTSVTLGATATLAIGIAGATGKYRAAATFTTPDQWVNLGLTAAMLDPLAAEEQLLATVAAAALPASGRLLVRGLFVPPS